MDDIVKVAGEPFDGQRSELCVKQAMLAYNEKPLGVAKFKRRNGNEKTIKIKGKKHTVQELMEITRMILTSDQSIAEQLASCIIWISDTSHNDKDNEAKKNNSGK